MGKIESGDAEGKLYRYLISRSNYVSLCLLIPPHHPQGGRIWNINHMLSLVAAITKKKKGGTLVLSQKSYQEIHFSLLLLKTPLCGACDLFPLSE